MKLQQTWVIAVATITVSLLATTVPSKSEVLVDETEAQVARQAQMANRYSEAKRYDVTITPPVRPGSQPLASLSPDQAMSPPAAASTGAAAPTANGDSPQARHSIDGGWSTEKGPAQNSSKPTAQPSQNKAATSAAAAVAAVAATPARAVYASDRPAMQVGAYRQASSAEKLKEKLLKNFDDVYVNQVVSGGEPLYRVRVGLGSRYNSLGDLKSQLAKGGYSCFPVSEPRP